MNVRSDQKKLGNVNGISKAISKLEKRIKEEMLIATLPYDGPSVKENIFKYFFSPPYFVGRKYI